VSNPGRLQGSAFHLFIRFNSKLMTMTKIVVRTGDTVPVSGQYKLSGGNVEATCVAGEHVPPNNSGVRQIWTLVYKTKYSEA